MAIDLTDILPEKIQGLEAVVQGSIDGSIPIQLSLSSQVDYSPQTISAGEVISAYDCIYEQSGVWRVCHGNYWPEVSKFVGLAANSAIVGSPVKVILAGVVQDSSWVWPPGSPLFIGNNGKLSLTPGDYVREVARAIAVDKILVNTNFPLFKD